MASAVGNNGFKPLTSIQANILDLVTDTVRLVQKYMEETPPEHWAIPLEAGLEAICLSEHYIQWVCAVMKSDVYPILSDLKDHEKIKPFLCPITLDLISYPVQDKQGTFFENSAIQERFDQCDGCHIIVRTPYRKGVLTKDELKYAPEYYHRVIAVFRNVLVDAIQG
ncbi:MAG: hypothetical protein PVI40_04530 [Chlamydiota bacterium]|jgi:hypothetical protein